MLNFLLNALILLAIILTCFLIVVAAIGGVTFCVALVGKILDIAGGGKNGRKRG